MTLVWYFFPKNVHGGFQMLTGFVQQVHVGWVLDVSRSHGGIHHELTPIFLLLLFLFQLLLEVFLFFLPLWADFSSTFASGGLE